MGYLAQVKPIVKDDNGFDVIIGTAGAGKTTYAGTYPKPLLHVSLGSDGGYKVLEGVQGIQGIILKTDKDVYSNKAGSKLMIDKLKELIIELGTTQHEFKSIVIDVASDLQEDLEIYYKKRLKIKQLRFDEWGQISEKLFNLFDMLERLSKKMKVVVLSHVTTRECKDDLTGTTYTKVLPAFTEKTAIRLCKNANTVMYITAKSVVVDDETVLKRVGIVGIDTILPTKIRLPQGKSLDNIDITDLDYTKLQELIKKL